MKFVNQLNSALGIVSLLIVLIFTSCGGDEATQESNPAVVDTLKGSPEACTFKVNPESGGVFWTSYKHTAKTPVTGKMDSVKIWNEVEADNLQGALVGLQFSVMGSSVNSNDVTRDEKLQRIFFGNIPDSENISGSILKIELSDETSGMANLMLKLNGVEREVKGDISVKGDEVEFSAVIDLLNFQMESAHAALQEACAEKHTGDDGQTKFWTEVKIVAAVKYTKTCG